MTKGNDAMKMLIVYYGDSPQYVEGFSPTCKRSCVGSLHLLPRRPLTVTEDEYEHLKARYPQLTRSVKIISKTAEEAAPPPPNVDEGPPVVTEPLDTVAAEGTKVEENTAAHVDEGKAKGSWLKKKAKDF